MTSAEKIADIKANPERHKHDFDELTQCCMVDGALDTLVMDAHSAHVDLGSNGGAKCDVTAGPCACGAWHDAGEKLVRTYDPTTKSTKDVLARELPPDMVRAVIPGLGIVWIAPTSIRKVI